MADIRGRIIEIIAAALEDMRDEYETIELAEPVEKTPLFGRRSSLDSLGLVSLIVDVEERVSEEFGRDIVLVDEKAMSQKVSPFLSVGSLARYIDNLLGKSENE